VAPAHPFAVELEGVALGVERQYGANSFSQPHLHLLSPRRVSALPVRSAPRQQQAWRSVGLGGMRHRRGIVSARALFSVVLPAAANTLRYKCTVLALPVRHNPEPWRA